MAYSGSQSVAAIFTFGAAYNNIGTTNSIVAVNSPTTQTVFNNTILCASNTNAAGYQSGGVANTFIGMGVLNSGDIIRFYVLSASIYSPLTYTSLYGALYLPNALSGYSLLTPTTLPTIAPANSRVVSWAGSASPDTSGLTRVASTTNGDWWVNPAANVYMVRMNYVPGTTNQNLCIIKNWSAGSTCPAAATTTILLSMGNTGSGGSQAALDRSLVTFAILDINDNITFAASSVSASPTVAPTFGVLLAKLQVFPLLTIVNGNKAVLASTSGYFAMTYGTPTVVYDLSGFVLSTSATVGDSWTVNLSGVFAMKFFFYCQTSSGCDMTIARNTPGNSQGPGYAAYSNIATSYFPLGYGSVEFYGELFVNDKIQLQCTSQPCTSATTSWTASGWQLMKINMFPNIATYTAVMNGVTPVFATNTPSPSALYYGSGITSAGTMLPTMPYVTRISSASAGDEFNITQTSFYLVHAAGTINSAGLAFVTKNAAFNSALSSLGYTSILTTNQGGATWWEYCTPAYAGLLSVGDILRSHIANGSTIQNAGYLFGFFVTQVSNSYKYTEFSTSTIPALGSGPSVTALSYGTVTAVQNQASILWTASAVNGDTFTVTYSGFYSAVLTFGLASGTAQIVGLSKNAAATTTQSGASYANMLALIWSTGVSGQVLTWYGVLSTYVATGKALSMSPSSSTPLPGVLSAGGCRGRPERTLCWMRSSRRCVTAVRPTGWLGASQRSRRAICLDPLHRTPARGRYRAVCR